MIDNIKSHFTWNYKLLRIQDYFDSALSGNTKKSSGDMLSLSKRKRYSFFKFYFFLIPL